MVGTSIVYKIHNRYYLILVTILFMLLMLLIIYILGKNGKKKEEDDNATIVTQDEFIHNNFDFDSEKSNIKISLIIFGVAAFISLICMVIIMSYKGFNLDYLYTWSVAMGLLFEFAVMPATKKNSEIRRFILRSLDMVIYFIIIFGSFYLISKYVFHFI